MKPFITLEITNMGKKILPFQCEGVDASRLALLLIGHDLYGCAMPTTHTLSATWAFDIFFGESQIQFSSACTQIGKWDEVGSLNIAVETTHPATQIEVKRIDFPVSRIVKIESIIFEDDDVITFCGLVITTKNNAELVIAAGIPPGSVSVKAPFLENQFQPQFSWDVCRREKIN